MTPEQEPSPYAALDRLPAETRAQLIAGLDAMAADPQIRRVRDAALAALAPSPGQRLLDVGSGAGEVARELAGIVGPDGHVTALDLSAASVEVARGRHDGGSVDYLVGDIQKLDFPDAAFDGVRTERVLQHLADPDLAVAELARVTRPGGRVCLVDTDWQSMALDGLPADLVATVRQAALNGIVRHHPDMGRTLRRRLVRAGLADVGCEPVTLWFTTPEAASAVLPFVDPRIPPKAGLIPGELREQWFTAIAEAGARSEFLAALTIWVAVGTRVP